MGEYIKGWGSGCNHVSDELNLTSVLMLPDPLFVTSKPLKKKLFGAVFQKPV